MQLVCLVYIAYIPFAMIELGFAELVACEVYIISVSPGGSHYHSKRMLGG